MNVPALETTKLCVRYGRKRAVNELELAVPTGSITALVGPNGAGKSTTLLTLVGVWVELWQVAPSRTQDSKHAYYLPSNKRTAHLALPQRGPAKFAHPAATRQRRGDAGEGRLPRFAAAGWASTPPINHRGAVGPVGPAARFPVRSRIPPYGSTLGLVT